MYAFRIRGGNHTLVELEPGELREAIEVAMNTKRRRSTEVKPVSAAEAHAFVRAGGSHETGLWVDAGRVRKAKRTA